MLKTNLPVLIVSDVVLFPFDEIKLDIQDENNKKIIDVSQKFFNSHVLFLFEKKKGNSLSKIGVIAKIKLKLDMPNGNYKVTLKGITRCTILDYHEEDIINANVTACQTIFISPIESLSKTRTLRNLFNEYIEKKKSLGNSIVSRIENINELGELTDIIVSFMILSFEKRKNYLYEVDSKKRYERLIDDIQYELSLLEYEESIDEVTFHNLEEEQKKYLLREKLKIITKELGEEIGDDLLLKKKIDELECPIRIKTKLNEELERYKLCNSNSPEIGILRNYIDTLLMLPWSVSTRENNDLDSIRKSLDESHYGLNEVKERIIEFMATKKYTKMKNNPIICLVGPPGIGKTSLAKAVSVALKRKCVKISVGGISDEAEITGHRRAYVGALPGKIISGIIRAGVNNPVFIIDEIDKMTKDIKGDPASSLLEVLDKEQNERFVDHFVEEEFDLSKVMFILTANYLDKIPYELRDRLEIIELNSYTTVEKCAIVKNSLLKKLRLEYHLTKSEINLTDESIAYIINHYTKESGIRELERLIRKMCRKYICNKLEKNISLDMNKNIVNFLGREKYIQEDNYPNDFGVMNILSYHPLGGELIKIESTMYQGDGKITASGSLGDVMKESINLSLAYIKSHAKDFHLSFEVFLQNDFFIHLTNGGIKKEGPSAGTSIVTSLLSLLKNIKIKNNVAMSGEISLNGKILRVGGLREKIVLALENNIDKIYFPLGNREEVLSMEDIYQKKLKVVFVDNYLEIYRDLFEKNK